MYSISKIIGSAIILILGIHSSVSAQINYSGYEIGVNGGTLIYQGDLTPKWYGYTKSIRPAIGLYASKSLDGYFSLRANFTRGRILADESKYSAPSWRQYRNFKFSTSITEFSALLVFNPFGQNNQYNFRRLSAYAFAGGGLTFLNVKRDWSRFNTTYFDTKSLATESLAADTVHTTPLVVGVLPLGVGLKYILSQRLALNAEGTYHLTSSDYVDGFSYKGQGQRHDNYYGISLGVSFLFGKDKYACPTVPK